MRRRSIVLFGTLTVLLAAAVALAVAAQRRVPGPVTAGTPTAIASGLPVLWQVPSFSFPDQLGRPTSTKDLRGHVWIANFFFTRCTSVCPLITAKLAQLQRRLTDPQLRFVSFSVDPERDTPEALKHYAGEWRPGESRWHLLGTTPSGLASLASGMYVSVEPEQNDIAHAKLFFLVDAQGGVRGIYESEKDEALEHLVEDATTLVGAPRGAASPGSRVSSGDELYRALGCDACHARRELAPALGGLVGRRVKLDGGAELTADAAYVRESLVAPNAKQVAGYLTLMPSYANDLTPSELDALVDYVVKLTAPTTKTAETAELVLDPVCGMKVRVTDKTPRTTQAGRTVYFCSEMCRDRFVSGQN